MSEFDPRNSIGAKLAANDAAVDEMLRSRKDAELAAEVAAAEAIAGDAKRAQADYETEFARNEKFLEVVGKSEDFDAKAGALNDAAELELFGSRGRGYFDNDGNVLTTETKWQGSKPVSGVGRGITGEEAGGTDPKPATKGFLDELKTDPKYGQGTNAREKRAKEYLGTIESLREEHGLELYAAKEIADIQFDPARGANEHERSQAMRRAVAEVQRITHVSRNLNLSPSQKHEWVQNQLKAVAKREALVNKLNDRGVDIFEANARAKAVYDRLEGRKVLTPEQYDAFVARPVEGLSLPKRSLAEGTDGKEKELKSVDLKVGYGTDIKTGNDYVLADESSSMYGIVDGKHNTRSAGETASLAAQVIWKRLKLLGEPKTAEEAGSMMRDALDMAHAWVRVQDSESTASATIVRVVEIEGKKYVTHALAGAGNIFIKDAESGKLEIVASNTDADADAIGSRRGGKKGAKRNVGVREVRPGDRIVVTTGSVDALSPEAVSAMNAIEDPKKAAQVIAKRGAADQDNSAIVIDVPKVEVEPKKEAPKKSRVARLGGAVLNFRRAARRAGRRARRAS